MARFIARKNSKSSISKILKISIPIIILLFLIISVILKRFFNHNNIPNYLNIISGNTYGNLLPTANLNIEYQNLFLKNIYGYNLNYTNKVYNNSNNIEELVIEKNLGEKIVYLYNTYQTEKYKSNYSNSYNVNSLITHASLILKEYLERDNISTLVETNSVAKTLKNHNLPYTNSYRASRILLEEAKTNHPSLKYYFDLALSDYDYNETTVQIENKNYAKILFIVGTDNPNYYENQKMAQELNTILNDLSPELSRGISLRGGAGYHGVYNQDYAPTVLQIQVGGIDNTIDEVNRSLKILANVIRSYIKANEKENSYEKK